VDYIQAVQSGKTGVNREQQISFISSRLRALQVHLGCPLVTGSQLNKDGEAGESAQIFNDSTRFMRISRPQKDLNGASQQAEGQGQYYQTLEQMKNRTGETGQVSFNFNTECGYFCDLQSVPNQNIGSNVANF
jgi:replicative DNA helicase